VKKVDFIEFCSRSSLWIYLWHILFLNMIPLMFDQNWMEYYIMVLMCSIGTCYVQNRIIDKLESRNINGNVLKLFRE